MSEGVRDRTDDQTRTRKTGKTGKGQNGKKNGTIAERTGEEGKEEDPKLRTSRVRDDLDRFRLGMFRKVGEVITGIQVIEIGMGRSGDGGAITPPSSKALIGQVSLIITVISSLAFLPVGKQWEAIPTL